MFSRTLSLTARRAMPRASTSAVALARTHAVRTFAGVGSTTGGRFRMPPARGETMMGYAPGSPERAALEEALARARKNVVEIPCVVNGVEHYTGDVVEQTMPSDHGHVLARCHMATPELVREAVDVSQRADVKDAWELMPFEQRAAIFHRAADLLSTKHRADIAAAVMLGTGKTVWQAEIDTPCESIDFLRLNTNYAEFIYDQQPPLQSPKTWNRVEYRPLEGFVLAITPFNFAAIGVNLPAAPALMGNTVIWKPATTAVLGNYLLYKLLLEAGLPKGVISFLPGSGRVIGGETVPSKHFAGLHFTGSTTVFNQLWRQIGENLPNYTSYPRIVGETGGKNFHLIDRSADMEHAVMSTLRGAFEYQGQKCSATSRLYIGRSLWPQFEASLLEKVAQIRMGQPDDMSTFMTAVIDKAAFTDITGYIEHARADESCTIIAGGGYDDSVGYFVEPTVIVTTDPHTKTMREEIFGPVLTVYVYDDADVVTALAAAKEAGASAEAEAEAAAVVDASLVRMCELIDNTTPYALTGAIFGHDRTFVARASELLRNSAGNFYINDKSTGAVVGEQPFGGGRASGTNDKAGSFLNLLRWVNARTMKEYMVPLETWQYPHMK